MSVVSPFGAFHLEGPGCRLVKRRQFIATSGSALMLGACARTGMPSHGPSPELGCVPRVLISSERLIRSVAGLRPYRASGFVVRKEMLPGGKVLIHNYGHGGAGITLSWGSSRLAVELLQQPQNKSMAVIGAGIMGLSTARLLQERGHEVVIYAAQSPPHTTSNIAGGQIHPASHYDRTAVDEAWLRQYRSALDYSWRRFQLLVGEDYGIRWLTTFEGANGAPLPMVQPAARVLNANEHPFDVDRVRCYDTMYVETGRYLRKLSDDFLLRGGKIETRVFRNLSEVISLEHDTVFNCTGLGAKMLFGDEGMSPRRGQLAVLLPQPEIRYAYTFGSSYMFPRPDGIVLGGTYESGIWDEETTPDAISSILGRNAALFASRCP